MMNRQMTPCPMSRQVCEQQRHNAPTPEHCAFGVGAI